jgi:hypothetical protein
MYFVEPLVFLRFAEKHNLIRVQERCNAYRNRFEEGFKIMNEETYSVPLKLLRRFEGE